jgi:hypothetical protein
MTARTRIALTLALTLTVLALGAAAAWGAPTIPAGAGWDVYHGAYPGYCLGCHTGFAVQPGSITAGATPPHGDRGSTCTQCHTVVTPPPADTVAPVTTSDAKATYTSSAAITLSATDGGSGVAATHYRLDGGADTVGTSVSTSIIGSHTLEFWSVDVAGNIEAHKTVTFTVSAPAPVDEIAPATSSDAVASYTVSATIHLTATDTGGSGVAATHYRLDGGADTVGTVVTTSLVGAHTLEFWSVDAAGNVELPHNTVAFVVEAPPVVDPPATGDGHDRDHDRGKHRGREREDRREREERPSWHRETGVTVYGHWHVD